MSTFSLEQISKTGILDAKLILRQYKQDLMARFMENKFINPKIKQKQTAKEMGYSDSTLKHGNAIKMDSPYGLMGPKRTQMAPNRLKRPQRNPLKGLSLLSMWTL